MTPLPKGTVVRLKDGYYPVPEGSLGVVLMPSYNGAVIRCFCLPERPLGVIWGNLEKIDGA